MKSETELPDFSGLAETISKSLMELAIKDLEFHFHQWSPPKPMAILCRHYDFFRTWCQQHGLYHRDRHNVIYVDVPEKALTLRDAELHIFWGADRYAVRRLIPYAFARGWTIILHLDEYHAPYQQYHDNPDTNGGGSSPVVYTGE